MKRSGETVSIVWDKNGKFFQAWQSSFHGDGKSHAESVAKVIGGTFKHVEKDEE